MPSNLTEEERRKNRLKWWGDEDHNCKTCITSTIRSKLTSIVTLGSTCQKLIHSFIKVIWSKSCKIRVMLIFFLKKSPNSAVTLHFLPISLLIILSWFLSTPYLRETLFAKSQCNNHRGPSRCFRIQIQIHYCCNNAAWDHADTSTSSAKYLNTTLIACLHAFFYTKVVHKKVHIKWPKIKKVLIYSIIILRNFFV